MARKRNTSTTKAGDLRRRHKRIQRMKAAKKFDLKLAKPRARGSRKRQGASKRTSRKA